MFKSNIHVSRRILAKLRSSRKIVFCDVEIGELPFIRALLNF